MISTPCDTSATGRRAHWARLLADLFVRADYRVKAPCLRCGAPFAVQQEGAEQDKLRYCPGCLPRKGGVQNAAGQCDCGRPTIVIVYLPIHQPNTPSAKLAPVPLCEVCAVDELLAALKKMLPD